MKLINISPTADHEILYAVEGTDYQIRISTTDLSTIEIIKTIKDSAGDIVTRETLFMGDVGFIHFCAELSDHLSRKSFVQGKILQDVRLAANEIIRLLGTLAT